MLVEDFLSLVSEVKTFETLNKLYILDCEKNKNVTALNFEKDEDKNDRESVKKNSMDDKMLKSFVLFCHLLS